MSEKEYDNGLVLGGGGARGCYEIGAWQAFDECDIHFDCVSGTSIGAMIAAMYVQQTIRPLEKFVEDLKPTSVAVDMLDFPENFTQLVENRRELLDFVSRYINTGMDISPLREALEKMFSYEKFMASPIDFACWTFNMTTLSGQAFFKTEMTPENALNIILASASCFPAFPMLEMDGQRYIDGGYENNIPADLAVEMGARNLVIINVHGPGREKPVPEGVNYLYIQPLVPLGNFLDFSDVQGLRSMKIGRLETLKYLGKRCGYLYTFPEDQWPAIYVFERFVQLYLDREHLYFGKECAQKALGYALTYRPVELHNRFQQEYDIGLGIEALAYMFNVDYTREYGTYREFLETLSDHLWKADRARPEISLKNRREIRDILISSRREEVILIIHEILHENKGRIPLLLDPVKNLAETAYQMALLWYDLDGYLKKERL